MLENCRRKALTMLSTFRAVVLDRGAPPVVYGLLVDVIGLAVVVAVAAVATQLPGLFPNAGEVFRQMAP
jgi:Flp pilus assembly pilin Flp